MSPKPVMGKLAANNPVYTSKPLKGSGIDGTAGSRHEEAKAKGLVFKLCLRHKKEEIW